MLAVLDNLKKTANIKCLAGYGVSFNNGDNDDKTLKKEASEAGIYELPTKRSGHPNGLTNKNII